MRSQRPSFYGYLLSRGHYILRRGRGWQPRQLRNCSVLPGRAIRRWRWIVDSRCSMRRRQGCVRAAQVRVTWNNSLKKLIEVTIKGNRMAQRCDDGCELGSSFVVLIFEPPIKPTYLTFLPLI